MKHTLSILIIILLFSSGTNRKYKPLNLSDYVSITNMRYSHLLFYGIRNSLEIKLPEGYSVEFEGCITEKIPMGLVVIPTNKDKVTVELKQPNDNGKGHYFTYFDFRVLELPKPIIKLGKSGSRFISKDKLNDLPNFECRQNYHFEHFLNYEIIRFRGQIMRENEIIHKWNQVGNEINKVNKEIFSKLISGDNIIIDRAFVRLDETVEIIEIEPTVFEIR